MAEAATQLRPVTQERQVMILFGKVTKIKKHEGNTYTDVVAPGASEYEHPSSFTVKSKTTFANIGEEFGPLKFRVTGFLKPEREYAVKNGANAGELVKIRDQVVNFELVE